VVVAVVCAIAFLAPLWAAKYPPFVDLPQHAAQLSIWKHLHDPAFGFEGRYVLNWRTPYLLVYLLALPLLGVTTPLVALKIVVSLGVLALPAALWFFLRGDGDEGGGAIDPVFALMGFPLAYGFALSWGFLNCALASAPALVLLALARRQLARPTRSRSALLVLVGVALFYTHALIFAFTLGLAALIALARGARALMRLWPLALPLGWAALWFRSASTVAQAHGPLVWALSWDRVLWAPSLELGHPRDFTAALIGLLLLALPFVAHLPRRRAVVFLPFAAVVAAVLLAPHFAFGTAYLFGRFAVFLVPMLLFAISPRRTPVHAALARTLVVATCLTWAMVLVSRFVAFDEEARAWDDIEAKMAPGRQVRAIIAWRVSLRLPGNSPVYEHFPMYYQADKGGLAGFSFAENFLSFARYANPAEARVSALLQQHPEGFDWRREPAYDYYVVRSPVELGPSLFAGAGAAVREIAQSGDWWLYQRVAAFPTTPR
jgi:hypothetical protein